MDQNWCKPRKIIHLDQLEKSLVQEEKGFLEEKWKIIEQTITAYLLQDSKPPSIVFMNRALQTLLVRDKYEQLHQNLIKTFYSVYKVIINQSFLKNCTLKSLLAYYIHKKQHYRIIFDVLNSFLNSYATADKLTIQQKAYQILGKEMLNSPYFDKFNQQFQEIVNQFRVSKDHTQILSIQYQLKIVSLLGIYQYFDQQFIDKSKLYYVNFAISMSKNEDMFIIIDEAIKREVGLNKLLKPSQNTISYLQKELIEQYFPFMIEFMEYLIQQSKYDKLRLLWKYTLRLNEQEKQLLYVRFKQIVNDVGRYLVEGENITKMLSFIDNIINIIKSCFESNKIMFNSLYNTVEETLTHNEKQYNAALAYKLLQSKEKQSYETIQQLFKFIPNKEKFIKQLQVYCFKWFMSQNAQNACYQQGIIQIIKKECGIALCRKLQRMLNDVWRDGEMVYYSYRPCNFKCRLLSMNDWPKFKYRPIMLPDSMSSIILKFENQFKKSPQHACKQLIWVSQLGTMKLAINGVQSIFSQIEAALIFILARSFRPMKHNQLVEVLQGNYDEVGKLLNELTQSNILEYNQMNQTYDINDSNAESYLFKASQQSRLQEVSMTEKKDNTIIIEAIVVKIMKKKKLLPKTQLSNLVFQQMRTIKPTLQEINASIERLAKRDFIQIDKMKGIIRYKE